MDSSEQAYVPVRHVLMLCKAFPPITGGVESYSEQVARAYLDRGYQVTVVTQTGGSPGWRSQAYAEGSLYLFDTGLGGQSVTALRMRRELGFLLKKTPFDLVHATTWRPAAALVGLRTPPIIVTVHGREVLKVPALLRPAMWSTLRKAQIVVTVSSETLARARRRFGRVVDTSDWVVSGNGLSFVGTEVRQWSVQSSRPVRFLTLARLVERKNVQGCIEAFRILKSHGYSNFEYHVAGTGPLAHALQRQVDDAGMSDQITFLGFIPDTDVAAAYRRADVFLHPQIDVSGGDDFEGFGISIADAMAFGCLAIAGAGSGPSDFITNEETGILVDGMEIDRLTEVIKAVLDSPDRFGPIACSGQRHVTTELSWSEHINRYLLKIGR